MPMVTAHVNIRLLVRLVPSSSMNDRMSNVAYELRYTAESEG